ncbi:TPA: hypothetical protein I7778_09245 [Vibrio vulnificus]|nr:hypothetical protein [Vibrio vulnificus]HAS8567909.1 hypothetical protein [Vibrio vulnificus]
MSNKTVALCGGFDFGDKIQNIPKQLEVAANTAAASSRKDIAIRRNISLKRQRVSIYRLYPFEGFKVFFCLFMMAIT